MADYNINLTIQNIWSIFRIVLDISVVWFVLYNAIRFVRNNNRTIQIFKGIIAIVIVNGLSKLLGLSTVAYYSDVFINWGFLAAIIIFQPEIRGVLERIGTSNAFSRIGTLLNNEKEKLIDELYKATIQLSDAKMGALISIEQSQSLQDYINTGVKINAQVSKELLCSIFMTTTPLHDGAVIIQGDKITCASAYFPPTSVNLSSRYGARHRAALGISEVTDALTIVVSEETSNISIAENGRIFGVTREQLKDYLRKVILDDEIEIGDRSNQRVTLSMADEPEIIVEKKQEREINQKGFFKSIKKRFGKKENEQTVEETKNDIINDQDIDMKNPMNNRIKYFEQVKQNEASNNIDDDEVLDIQDNSEEDGE